MASYPLILKFLIFVRTCLQYFPGSTMYYLIVRESRSWYYYLKVLESRSKMMKFLLSPFAKNTKPPPNGAYVRQKWLQILFFRKINEWFCFCDLVFFCACWIFFHFSIFIEWIISQPSEKKMTFYQTSEKKFMEVLVLTFYKCTSCFLLNARFIKT
jgi:hypothetical protein